MTTTIGIDPGQATGIAIYRDAALCERGTFSVTANAHAHRASEASPVQRVVSRQLNQEGHEHG